mmetsp:Transcript_136176/g.339596  ORF Transcript_136176/g.339596 Transcript_136176/m.339596 type:complete len:284 (-) Transcript_136176:66-917(-)
MQGGTDTERTLADLPGPEREHAEPGRLLAGGPAAGGWRLRSHGGRRALGAPRPRPEARCLQHRWRCRRLLPVLRLVLVLLLGQGLRCRRRCRRLWRRGTETHRRGRHHAAESIEVEGVRVRAVELLVGRHAAATDHRRGEAHPGRLPRRMRRPHRRAGWRRCGLARARAPGAGGDRGALLPSRAREKIRQRAVRCRMPCFACAWARLPVVRAATSRGVGSRRLRVGAVEGRGDAVEGGRGEQRRGRGAGRHGEQGGADLLLLPRQRHSRRRREVASAAHRPLG